MSEIPPPNDPSRPPPPQYAGYTRPSLVPGGPDDLQALADGYFGLNNIFVFNIVWVVAFNAYSRSAPTNFTILFIFVGVTVLLIGGLTYPYNKKIAQGMRWSPSAAGVASLLMGLNSALCCGIIGYVVMQSIAAKEMRKYGVTGGAFGMKKKLVQAVIDRMRTTPTAPAVPPGPFQP